MKAGNGGAYRGEHFAVANAALAAEIRRPGSTIAEDMNLSDKDLDTIFNARKETFDPFTIHHENGNGDVQYLDRYVHDLFRHTGGYSEFDPSGQLLARDVFQQQIVDTMGTNIEAHPLRQAYEAQVSNLARYEDMIRPGMTEVELEDIAMQAWQARRELAMEFREITPDALRDYIYDVNQARYGDPEGPGFDRLVDNRFDRLLDENPLATREDALTSLIEGASRSNDNVDKLLSGFDGWLSEQSNRYIIDNLISGEAQVE